MSCSTASIVPMRLISTATHSPAGSLHMRSTGPTSVGHSRLTSTSSSPSADGRGGEHLLQVALDAVLLERGRLAHVVDDVAQHLDERDLEHVLRLRLADDEHVAASSIAVGAVIQFSGLKPPASSWTRTEPSALRMSRRTASGRTAVRRPE